MLVMLTVYRCYPLIERPGRDGSVGITLVGSAIRKSSSRRQNQEEAMSCLQIR